jgi:hypothetical protein
VDGRVVFSGVVLPEDDNIMPKHVGATLHNKLNEYLVYLLAFHAFFTRDFDF